jgi:anti-anti-sigma factor
MSVQSSLEFARTPNGFVIRVVGHGTMTSSPAFRELAEQCLATDSAKEVVVDLEPCAYLDSTFLGCLIQVHKRCRDFNNARFAVVAERTKRTKLFSTSMLDRLLHFVDEVPAATTEYVSFTTTQLASEELGLHILRCHQRLAELCGEDSAKFQSIANRLAKELNVDP